jgi:hypothetical protein
MPSCPPIASRQRAGRRGRESYQCQLAMGALQAEPVLWCQAAHTEELDGRADVDAGGGLPECAE